MNKHISIAVLLSSYNGEAYIREQIDSILDQKKYADDGSIFNVSLYVRDDGSTDSTLEILNEYETSGKIIIIDSDINLGPAKSFLTLLSLVDADYYAFSDQDDVWLSDKLSCALNALKRESVPAVYYSNADLVDENLISFNKQVYSPKQFFSLEKAVCSCNVLGCSMVLNDELKRIFVKVPFIDMTIGMHDYFLCMLCMACNGHIIFDSKSTMLYRQHGNNAVGYDVSSSFFKRLKRIFQKNKVSVEVDAKNMLRYYDDLSEEGKIISEIACDYRHKFSHRIQLAFRVLNLCIKHKGTKHEMIAFFKILIGTE